MKQIKFFSKSFRDLFIGLMIVKFINTFGLYLYKVNTILTGEVAYGHSLFIFYCYYIILIIMSIACLIIPYIYYKHLIKNNITKPKLWKLLYMILFSLIMFCIDIYIIFLLR